MSEQLKATIENISQSDFYAFLSHAPMPVAILKGPEFVYEFSNKANQRFFNGVQMVGKRARDIPHVTAEMLQKLESVYRSGEPFILQEYPAQFVIEGQETLVHINLIYSPFRNKEGQVEGILVTGTDVTDLVLAKKQAEFRERESLRFLDGISHIVWIADPEGKVKYLNRRWWEYTGLRSDTFKQTDALECIHPDDRTQVNAQWEQSLLEKGPFDRKFRLKSSSGNYFWHLCRLVPTPDEVGNIIEWVGTMTNIQEWVDANDLIMQTNGQLERALQARQELLNICGHELKTPLCGLKLFIQTAQRKIEKNDSAIYAPETIQKLIHIFEEQVERLVRLVDDMLDFTRITSGKLTLNMEKINLSSLIIESIERQAELFEQAGCRVQTSLDPLVFGIWDRFRIEQVITNLLSNAMKYGKGTPISISVIKNKDLACIRVKDEGIGIARANHERIFQRFERAISANEISGLGLGLYIVKEIVRAHKGRIWVESEPGKGSSFFVELPCT